MPKSVSLLTSPKIKKLAAKALKSPSMLTSGETRELGASVMAHLQPPVAEGTSRTPAKKQTVKKVATKKLAAKNTASKKTTTKKTAAVTPPHA